MIYDECSRFLSFSCPSSVSHSTSMRTRVSMQESYFPSPLFSRLHDLARLSFFPSLVSPPVSPPVFLLSHSLSTIALSLSLSLSLFRRLRCCRRHVVTPHIFSSYFAVRFTPSDAFETFACHFIGNANFLSVHTSNRMIQTNSCSLTALFGATLDFSAWKRINCKNKYE